MSKKLKIECDLEKPMSTMIFFNEKLVGCVQEFEFKADIHNFRPTIKFVFPDFEGSEKEIKELFENSPGRSKNSN